MTLVIELEQYYESVAQDFILRLDVECVLQITSCIQRF